MKSLIPSPEAIAREVVLVLTTAVIVALIVNHTPGLKAWLKEKGAIPHDI